MHKQVLPVALALVLLGCPSSNDPADSGTGGGSTRAGGGSGGGSAGGGTGGSTGTGGGSSITPITLTTFCAQYAARACTHEVDCGNYSPNDAGAASCLERETDRYRLPCAQLDGLTFNGVAAAECFKELGEAPGTCKADWAPCGQTPFALNGTFYQAPAQHDCGAVTCGPGTYCDRNCLNLMCKPLQPLGAACANGEAGRIIECNPDAGWCGTGPDAGSMCLDYLAPGDDCTLGVCPPHTFCDYRDTVTCKLRGANGATCAENSECLINHCLGDGHCGTLDAGAPCRSAKDCRVCVGLSLSSDGGVVAAGTCRTTPLQTGAACRRTWANGGIACDYAAANVCLDGMCTLIAPFSRPLGAECVRRPYGVTTDRDFGFSTCEPGLTCQTAAVEPPGTGTCQPALAEGAACRDLWECANGRPCLQGADGGSVCTRKPTLGETCNAGQCTDDARCVGAGDGGRECRPLGRLDEPCGSYFDCTTGNFCDQGLCKPLRAAGATCTQTFECLSGYCSYGQCAATCR